MDYDLLQEATIPTDTTMKIVAVYKRGKKKYYDAECSECKCITRVRADAVKVGGYKQQRVCRKCSYIERDGHSLEGMTNKYPKLYSVFTNMHNRCYNPKNSSYPNYGAKGVFIHSNWKNNFLEFLKWALNQGHTYEELCERELDKDILKPSESSGIYGPGTCLFVTRHLNNIVKPKTGKITSSEYVGVNWGKSTERWEWGLRLSDGTRKRGYGKTELDAAQQREKYILLNNLSHRRNFNG